MQQPLPTRARTFAAPSFYLTGRQRLRPGVILLAIIAATGAVGAIVDAMNHSGHARLTSDGTGTAGSAGAGAGASGAASDDDDDPSQIDTIVLGDPTEAPRPGHRGDHVSPVHPTIVVRLPRYGDKVGLIPNSSAGHLLYDWLAAFNKANSSGLAEALPTVASGPAAAAQMQLRRRTGGFNLLSAKEVQPGLLVFRLRDQTPSATEALGTLQVSPDSVPAAIATFSLRSVAPPSQDAATGGP